MRDWETVRRLWEMRGDESHRFAELETSIQKHGGAEAEAVLSTLNRLLEDVHDHAYGEGWGEGHYADD